MSSVRKNIKISVIKTVISFFNAIGMKKNKYTDRPERVLVITASGIGDTIWGTPAIRALKETYPECYVGVLTNPSGLELLKGNPNIDEFFVFRRGLNGFFSLPPLLKKLRQKKFEAVLVFHSSERIAWPLAFFTGAMDIIGISGSSKELDFMLTKPVVIPPQIHCVEERLALVKEIGAYTNRKSIEIFLTSDDRKQADQLLHDIGIDKGSFIAGIHPGAQDAYKCWPVENFTALGNSLAERLNCSVLVTGSRDEMDLAGAVSSKISRAINLAGKLTLRETAAIIEKMNVYVSNDTGPMHMAFALKTPTVALFSPTDHDIYGPYELDGKYRIIAKQKTCDPCIRKKCHKPLCMNQITVGEVISEAEHLIKDFNKKI